MDTQAGGTSAVLVVLLTVLIGIISAGLLWTYAREPAGGASTGRGGAPGSEAAAPQQGRAAAREGGEASPKQALPTPPPLPAPPARARPGQGNATEKLLPFFRGTGTDNVGRRLAEIRAWDFHQMEVVHDYVQWMFPTDEMSEFNANSPILAPEIQMEFKSDPVLRRELALNFERFCQFLGLEVQRTGTDILVTIGPNFEERKRDCWQPMGFFGNHNWLRVSRVLHCLGLCSMPQEQKAFMACLEEIFAKGLSTCAQSIPHWRKRAGTVPNDSCT